MSCVLNGTVSATYHGFSHWPWHDVALWESTPRLCNREADHPAQVVVTVQIKQARQQAPLVRAVLGCGVGEAGERRAAEVRLALARGTLVSLVGEAITYCARSNNLTVRGLKLIEVISPSGQAVSFNSLRPTTLELTTTP